MTHSETHRKLPPPNILKSHATHRATLYVAIIQIKRSSNLLPDLSKQRSPLTKGVIRLDALVVGVDPVTWLPYFEVAAGFQDAVGFGEEGVPRRNRADQPANVDVIEGVSGVGPGLGCVFNFAVLCC